MLLGLFLGARYSRRLTAAQVKRRQTRRTIFGTAVIACAAVAHPLFGLAIALPFIIGLVLAVGPIGRWIAAHPEAQIALFGSKGVARRTAAQR